MHTIRFHIDDLMSGHEDAKVNDKFPEWLNKKCGAHDEVKAIGGNEHNCPGMTFEFDVDAREVKIDTREHIKNMLKEFPVKFHNECRNIMPSGVSFFDKDNSKKLTKEMKTVFHRTTVQG